MCFSHLVSRCNVRNTRRNDSEGGCVVVKKWKAKQLCFSALCWQHRAQGTLKHGPRVCFIMCTGKEEGRKQTNLAVFMTSQQDDSLAVGDTSRFQQRRVWMEEVCLSMKLSALRYKRIRTAEGYPTAAHWKEDLEPNISSRTRQRQSESVSSSCVLASIRGASSLQCEALAPGVAAFFKSMSNKRRCASAPSVGSIVHKALLNTDQGCVSSCAQKGRKEGKGEEGNGWVWKQETRVSVIKGCNEDLFTSTLQVSEVANILLVSSFARAECRVQQRRADSQFLVVKVFLLIHRCVVANIQNSHHTAKACVHHTGLSATFRGTSSLQKRSTGSTACGLVRFVSLTFSHLVSRCNVRNTRRNDSEGGCVVVKNWKAKQLCFSALCWQHRAQGTLKHGPRVCFIMCTGNAGKITRIGATSGVHL